MYNDEIKDPIESSDFSVNEENNSSIKEEQAPLVIPDEEIEKLRAEVEESKRINICAFLLNLITLKDGLQREHGIKANSRQRSYYFPAWMCWMIWNGRKNK